MNILIICSAYISHGPYLKDAEDFCSLMCENKCNLVWGGSDIEMMKVIADRVRQGGGKLYGFNIPIYEHVSRKDADEIIMAETLGQRKLLMLDKCDSVVMFAGGIGTLDEFGDILELKKQKYHNKKIVLLNTNGFYEGLKTQLKRMEMEKFIPIPLKDLVYFAETPKEAFEYLK